MMKKTSMLYQTLIAAFVFLVIPGKQTVVAQNSTTQLKDKKIVMVVASNGYRDEEFEEPFKYFQKQGATVLVASSSLDEAQGKLGGGVKPDKLLNDISVSDFDAIVFVGGPGAREYFSNDKALSLVKEANKSNKVVAAICIAPNVLNNAGILKGKKATAWSFNNRNTGVIIVNKSVVVDGNIVTANGPYASTGFAEAISVVLRD